MAATNQQQAAPQPTAPSIWATDIQLATRYSVSRQTIWRWVQSGHLPHPVKLTPGCTRWRLADVEQMEQGAK